MIVLFVPELTEIAKVHTAYLYPGKSVPSQNDTIATVPVIRNSWWLEARGKIKLERFYVDMEKLTYWDGQPKAFQNSNVMAFVRALTMKEASDLSIETLIESIIKTALKSPEKYSYKL